MNDRGRPARLLLVEDESADVHLAKHALDHAGLDTEVTVARDGEEALELLESGYVPDLALLDISLPGMTGTELLGRIKADERFRRIPVVMLTTSRHPDDVLAAYDNHAAGFLNKSMSGGEFLEAIRALGEFWFSAVTLPTDV